MSVGMVLKQITMIACMLCFYRMKMYLSIDVLTGTFLTRKLYMRYILVSLKFNCPLSLLISVGDGSWAFDGIEMVSSTTEDGMTTVNCTSTHLTSFAVLVDVSGVLSSEVSSSFEVVCV